MCVFSSRANTVDGSLFSRRLAKGEMYIEEGEKRGAATTFKSAITRDGPCKKRRLTLSAIRGEERHDDGFPPPSPPPPPRLQLLLAAAAIVCGLEAERVGIRLFSTEYKKGSFD